MIVITAVRSALFILWMVISCAVIGLAFLPVLLGPAAGVRAVQRWWAHGMLWASRTILGLEYRIEGLEHVPEGACLLASKHQSMWETVALLVVVPRTVYVLKRELAYVPFFGWYALRSKQIFVDRGKGTTALRRLLTRARPQIAEGARLVIFPEGTRTAYGSAPPLKPGVVGLAHSFGVPVVPITLDSGRFWPRNGFLKQPGVITMRVLPPLDPKQPKQALLENLHAAINQSPS
jgi:1-acyl-sn-glycerol-3-phosphate acyltransferase